MRSPKPARYVMASEKKLTIGFIGYGNMGRALAGGVLGSGALGKRYALAVHDTYAPSARAAKDAGLAVEQDAAALVRRSDIVILAVKPYQVGGVLDAARQELGPDKLLLSIAAGVTLDALAEKTAGRCPVARVMPNTLALVGQGFFALCCGPGVQPELKAASVEVLESLGRLVELDESKFNAFTALSGSGPAYVFHFMDSLAEAGVSVGLDRETSRAIALSLVRGAAAMAEGTGSHPAVLREQVSSPAGTTIAALNHLDRTGCRGHLIDAVRAADARGREMEKEA